MKEIQETIFTFFYFAFLLFLLLSFLCCTFLCFTFRFPSFPFSSLLVGPTALPYPTSIYCYLPLPINPLFVIFNNTNKLKINWFYMHHNSRLIQSITNWHFKSQNRLVSVLTTPVIFWSSPVIRCFLDLHSHYRTLLPTRKETTSSTPTRSISLRNIAVITTQRERKRKEEKERRKRK